MIWVILALVLGIASAAECLYLMNKHKGLPGMRIWHRGTPTKESKDERR